MTESRRDPGDSYAMACRDMTHKHGGHWAVIQRKCNYSAFNGYRYTPSDYSAVKCFAPGCGSVWRTKAAYVDELPDSRRS